MVAGFRVSHFHQRWIFIIAGLVAILVAFITIGFQAIKAAGSEPGEELENGVVSSE